MTDVNALAAEIRRIDGDHTLGAGALAEALMPYVTGITNEAVGVAYARGRKDFAAYLVRLGDALRATP